LLRRCLNSVLWMLAGFSLTPRVVCDSEQERRMMSISLVVGALPKEDLKV
jgi:hypothetical protein